MIMSVCDVPDVLKVMRLVKLAITIIKIVVPIMLILSCMIDLIKNVISPDDLGQTGNVVTKKAMAAVIVFLIPTFVGIIFNLLGSSVEYKKCIDMVETTNVDELYEKNMAAYMNNLKNDSTFDNYNTAKAYLYNIKNDELKKKYTKELAEYEKMFSEKTSDGPVIPMVGGDFLEVAKKTWQNIVLGNKYFTYGPSSVPPSGSQINCSGYVSWVLYNYGYNDFKGWQHTTDYFAQTNFKEKYGWSEITISPGQDITNIVRPGDIIVRCDYGKKGHMDIVARVDGNTVYGYDAGASKSIKHGDYPDGKRINWFTKDDRPGKIIRVTPPNSYTY